MNHDIASIHTLAYIKRKQQNVLRSQITTPKTTSLEELASFDSVVESPATINVEPILKNEQHQSYPRFHFNFESRYGDHEFIPNPEIEKLVDKLLTISPIQLTTSIMQGVSCGISSDTEMKNIFLVAKDDDFSATNRQYYEKFLQSAGLSEAVNLRGKILAVNSFGIQESYFCQVIPYKTHESAFGSYFKQDNMDDASATAIIKNTVTGNTTIMFFKKNFFEQGVQRRGNRGVWMLSIPTQIANEIAIPALKTDPIQFTTLIMAKLVHQYLLVNPEADQELLKKLWNSCDFYTKTPKHHLFAYHITSKNDDKSGNQFYSKTGIKTEEITI